MLPKNQGSHPAITPSLLTIILLIVALMQLTTDLYIPSLPAITQSLGSKIDIIQLTLAIYMLGYSTSHLVYGPLSDRIGRKIPILAGIGISICGSLLCFFTPNATLLIIGRFIQGIGIGCCNSVGRSLARDLLTDRLLAKVGSQIGMLSVVILALSPTLGGYVQDYLGWRANFAILFIFGLIMWVSIFLFLPETNKHLNPHATQMKVMKENYLLLFRSKVFMGYTLCSCFAGAGLIAYLTIAPFLFQEKLGLSPIQFGWLAFVVAGSIFVSGFINNKMVLKKGIRVMVLIGCILMFIGGLLMLLLLAIKTSVLTILIPVAVFSLGAGFNFINAFAGAFDPFPKMAGTTGALFGGMQDICAAFASALVALLKLQDQYLLALILATLGLLSIFAWKYLASISANSIK
ncbi:multidrug resistance protein D (plasmid) [Legionella adelaidensis]|uniref:Bcr/CflA family efflux transporter n=1 Tax=Legionella adelaidensis TaxID=45056 RepID=A0A0W0R600_9GAMM|nr:multidrug effflux MFS transporter [Legionella adelaidensis]KTC66466.1 multidrug resistance protein D [Legionella adelaidensis]VEH86246.1 multidrug resistance protein D [Legionella adelaidensis]